MHNGDGEMLGRQGGQNQARRDAHLARRLEQASQPTCARVATLPAGTHKPTQPCSCRAWSPAGIG